MASPRPLAFSTLLGLAVLALSCGQREVEAPAIPYFDLVAHFDDAATDSETGTLLFGEPRTRPYLVRGWGADEVDQRRERPFVWSLGDESLLRFRLLEPRDLELTFEVRPYAFRGKPRQTIAVSVNGRPLETIALQRGVHPYAVGIPAAALADGENTVAFAYRHVRDEGEEGESRPLAVAWYELSFGGGDGVAAPRASGERGILFLPYRAELGYLVRIEPQTTLRFDSLVFRGGGRLTVWLETDAEGSRRVAEVTAGSEARAVAIPVDRPTPARLTLRATGGGEGGDDDGVVLESPALWSPDPARQAAAWRAQAPDAERRPHVVIYLVDSLRSDRLGCYGYERPISPALDAFAEEAVLFEEAVGQSSWTRASVASLFTGLWPDTHGAVGRRDRLAEEAVTLAESLQAAGYHTVAFATNPNIDARFGFDQGFDEYIHVRRGTDSPRLTARVLAWLESWRDERPLFLYVHTVDPHDPYAPPLEFVRRYAPESEEFLEVVRRYRKNESWEPSEENLYHLNRLYDAEVATNDASFGVLMDELRRRGLYDESLIAFVSDHGEEFHEHGSFTHGKNLFVETLNVPLVIRFPGQRRPLRVASPVQHTDLMPTVLDYLGLPIPPAVEGRSLAALAERGFAEPEQRSGRVYSHLLLDGALTVSVVDGEWKLIEHRGRRRLRRMLFDRSADPGETRDLSAEHPIRTAFMAKLLEDKLAGEGRLRREEIELDEELARSLRALGYLN